MGFEVIVRPAVFPNIRPAPARALAPEDAPDKGIAVLSGSGGGLLDLPLSSSVSWSRQHEQEYRRRFDVVRVHPTGGGKFSGVPPGPARAARAGKEGEDTGQDDFYVDIEVINRLEMMDGNGMKTKHRYADIQEADNIEILQRNVTRTSNL